MPRLRRGRRDASADARAHQLADDQTMQDRERRRHADAHARVRTAARTRRRLAGRLAASWDRSAAVIAGGILSGRRRPRRLAQGRHDANEAGISAQERRPLQRRRHRDGVLRSLRRPRRRLAAGRVDRGRRPDIPRAAVLDEQPFQEAERHFRLESNTMRRTLTACGRVRPLRSLRRAVSAAGAGTRGRAGSGIRHLRLLDRAAPRRRARAGRGPGTWRLRRLSDQRSRRGCSRCRTTRHASRSAIINATATWRRIRCGRSATRAPGKSAIHTRSVSSPFIWYNQTFEGHRTIWMDGRPHPPAWAPHTWMGFSTGRFVGQGARSADDASQAGLAAAKRAAGERSGDAGRVLRPPRRSPDAYLGDHRSGVPRRAGDPKHRLRPAADRSQTLAVRVRRRGADSRTAPPIACRTTLFGEQPIRRTRCAIGTRFPPPPTSADRKRPLPSCSRSWRADRCGRRSRR